jgi:hypothetical protein
MRNTIKILGIIALVAVIGFSTASCDFEEEQDLSLDELVGEWKGTYGPNQGETGLTLTVYKEGSNYKATFAFYNLPGKTNSAEGSYRMNVSSDKTKYYLKATEWISAQPDYYDPVNLEGTKNGNVFSGSRAAGSGVDFSVTKTN